MSCGGPNCGHKNGIEQEEGEQPTYILGMTIQTFRASEHINSLKPIQD